MSIHSCGYHCDLPACVKAQRDELRDKYIKPVDDRPVLTDAQLNELHSRLGGTPTKPTYNETKLAGRTK